MTQSVVLISLLLCAFGYYGIPWIYSRYAIVMLKRKATKCNSIALTFDDGPGRKVTPAILNTLANYNIKATFFLHGRHISGREEIVRQIVEQGHEICSHGYGHLDHWKVSPFRAVADIKHGFRAVNRVLGTKGGLYPFRPPYGRLNFISLLYLWIHAVPIVYWTFDSGDTWLSEKRDSHRSSVLEKVSGGVVMLAHDFDRISEEGNKWILELVQSVVTRTREKNIPTLTISQLLEGYS